MELPPDAPAPQLDPIEQREPLPSVALLGEAWRINFANLGTFVPLVLILMLVAVGVVGVQVAMVFANGIPKQPQELTDTQWLTSVAMGALLSAFFVYPFSAAIYKVCYNVFERSPSPLDGLKVFFKYYLPCAFLGLVVSVLTVAAEFAIRKAPAAGLADLVIGALINFPILLVVPAMVRFNMPLGKSIQYSIRRIADRPVGMLGYYIAASVLAVSGIIACCVGMIVTACIAQIALALLMPGFDFNRPPVNPQSPYPRQ